MLPCPAHTQLGLKRAAPATYVASGKRDNAGASSTLNLGSAQAGDFIVFFAPSGATIAGGSGGWTSGTAVSGAVPLTKVLTASDITGPLTCSSYPWVFAIYRNPIATARRASGSQFHGGPTLTGFTKAVLCAGLVGLCYGDTDTTSAGSFSGWTLRQTAYDGGGSAGYAKISLSDLLDPTAYTDGASIATSGSSNGTTYAAVDELLDS